MRNVRPVREGAPPRPLAKASMARRCLPYAKTASAYKAGEWDDTIPDEYMLQVQHYMSVTGYVGTYIAVLIGGNTFKWKFIERDEELISMLIELEADFWDYVRLRTPPTVGWFHCIGKVSG